MKPTEQTHPIDEPLTFGGHPDQPSEDNGGPEMEAVRLWKPQTDNLLCDFIERDGGE